MMGLSYRVATPAEIEHYEKRLYPLQDRVLRAAGDYGNSLVLTGGTALARCYLEHRFSDDIDFFTNLPRAGRVGADFVNTLRNAGFSVEIKTQNDTFLRAFVVDSDLRLQVDVAPDSTRLDDPQMSPLGAFVHSLRDIAANKVSAYEDRAEVKDVIDLYYLSKRFSWSEIFQGADAKRVPIVYGDLQNILATPLSGSALIKDPISLSELETFVVTLKDEIAIDVKKKVDACSLTIGDLVFDLLWDTPLEQRVLSSQTAPVVSRRLTQLSLPEQTALRRSIQAAAKR